MTDSQKKLKALNAVVQLQFDLAQARLHKHAAEREVTRALIAGLDRPSRLAGEDPILSAQVDLVYQSWADGRRAELNTILARQTAIWMESVAEARQCFGKTDALRQVATRLAVREARSEAD